MSRARKKIEKSFSKLGYLICRHRFKTIAIFLVFTSIIFYQLPKLDFDTSTEAMLQKDDPALLLYNEFRDQFGSSEIMLITVAAPEIFDESFLAAFQRFHRELEENIPYLKDVTSLINIRNTRGEGDTLYVEDLLKDWPDKGIDLEVLKKRVKETPMYTSNIITADYKIAAIVIETEASIEDADQKEESIEFGFEDSVGKSKPTGLASARHYMDAKESREVVEAVNAIVDKYQRPDFKIIFTGGTVIVDTFNRITASDMWWLSAVGVCIIIFFLSILFQRASGVVFPVVIVLLSLLTTFGFMAIFNSPITIMTVVIPSFLLAVGVGDSVHILAIFYRDYQKTKNKVDSIAYALEHSGLAVLMTSLTTAAGLLSFSTAELVTIAEMGRFAAAGVIIAFFYTVTLLPALIAIVPVETKPERVDAKTEKRMDAFLLFFAKTSTKFPKQILVIALIFFIVSIFYITQLRFSQNLIDFYPDDMKVKTDLLFVDDKLKGTITVEVVVDTEIENGIHSPEMLNWIEAFTKEAEKIQRPEIYVGKVFSIIDVLKETHKALHDNDPEYYTIPQDKRVIAQELLLFENSGSDDLEKLVDSQFSKTRITIKTPWVDSVIYDKFVNEVESMAESTFGHTATTYTSGLSALMGRTIPAALESMAESYFIAFFVITCMMILLLGYVKLGLLSMIPNVLPIVIVMGLIRFVGQPLNLNTLFIGSIAIGLVVDDTIHFMYNFRRYYDVTHDAYESIKETLLGTGRALLITSLVLSACFFSLILGTLKSTSSFGYYTAITILLALAADFLLAPALMVMYVQRKTGKQKV
jgi:predicted RND superfamily exporter protein